MYRTDLIIKNFIFLLKFDIIDNKNEVNEFAGIYSPMSNCNGIHKILENLSQK